MTVLVVGQIARDLVLRCDGMPESGGSTTITERRELVGGKGANQAVALTQLGVPAAVFGVVGDDDHGPWLLDQLAADGVDVSRVVRRGNSALLVDLVDGPGSRRLFEHTPAESTLTVEDFREPRFDSVSVVSLQLQQPGEVMVAAAEAAHRHRVHVIADGNPEPGYAEALLPMLDVLRLDVAEVEALTGRAPTSVEIATQIGAELLDAGPNLVAIAVRGVGDLVLWRDGRHLVTHTDEAVIDQTGAGDAFMGGLTAALLDEADPVAAATVAGAAARSTVARLGGRPELTALEKHWQKR
jgi:ribokinase